MLVMVVFFIAFRWIQLSTTLIRLCLLVLILLLMPTLNFLPVWFALSLLRFRLPSRLPMMFILFIFQAEDGIRDYKVTGVQTCALPISTQRPVRAPRRKLRQEPRKPHRRPQRPHQGPRRPHQRPRQRLLAPPRRRSLRKRRRGDRKSVV